MEPSPFNRKQWISQSLRITAKELSLVNKNKSSALVERFSKYQKAAEEATAEKKRNVSICFLGNKQYSRLRSRSPESGKMENCLGEPRREGEKPAGGEGADPAGRIEKCSVPLSKLKMMFEKGEAAQSKVPRDQRKTATSGRRISENSYSSEDFDVGQGEKSHSTSDKAESKKSLDMPRLTETSIKDRLAKYQAAVSKQGSATNLLNEIQASESELKNYKSEQKENMPPSLEDSISCQDGEKVRFGLNLESETEVQKPGNTKQQNFGSKPLGQTDASLPKAMKVKQLFIVKH
uniref:Uncharacterized protein n=1 Tax=Dromaius novaehollandiae TaxID=8790 RepID=A0A8C4JCF8_DRONO